MHHDYKKDFIWNTLGVFTQNAISPLLLIVITRVNGIYDSGIFSFAFSIAIIFWIFGMWGGRTYQVSDLNNEFRRQSYIMLRLMLAIIMLVGAVLFSIANNYDLIKSQLIFVLILFKAIESIADSIYGILQINSRLYIVGRSLFLKAIVSFIIFILIDLITKNIVAASLSIVFINFMFVYYYDLRNCRLFEKITIRKNTFNLYIHEALLIMKKCSAFFIISFLSSLSLNIPRYFIDKYYNGQIGYFGILAMPITLISLFVTLILQPSIVGLSKLYNDKMYTEFNKNVKKILFIALMIGLFILLSGIIAGIPLLEMVFGVSFKGYKFSLVVMLCGGITSALLAILVNILTIMRRFKAQFYIMLFSTMLLSVLSAVIIKPYGFIGGITLFALISAAQVVSMFIFYNIILRSVKNEKNN